MRDLTTNELKSVSGGRMVPTGPASVFGVKLSKKDQAALAVVLSLLRPRKAAQ